jgi:hypothetical protein
MSQPYVRLSFGPVGPGRRAEPDTEAVSKVPAARQPGPGRVSRSMGRSWPAALLPGCGGQELRAVRLDGNHVRRGGQGSRRRREGSRDAARLSSGVGGGGRAGLRLSRPRRPAAEAAHH